MNPVNVFDIATSEWYTQTTSGETSEARVNPCAVVAAAPDGSSTNVYMWVRHALSDGPVCLLDGDTDGRSREVRISCPLKTRNTGATCGFVSSDIGPRKVE